MKLTLISPCMQDEVQPRNVLTDLSLSLSAIDFEPMRSGEAQHERMVHICYDFPPHSGECPLLLAPPNDLKIEAASASKRRPRANMAGERERWRACCRAIAPNIRLYWSTCMPATIELRASAFCLNLPHHCSRTRRTTSSSPTQRSQGQA